MVQPASSQEARTPASAELVRDLGFYAVPKGIICMWSGTRADIPTGWALCDGSNGTPDMRGRFSKGAAAGADPGATGGGGTASHNSAGSHNHDSHSFDSFALGSFSAVTQIAAHDSDGSHSHTAHSAASMEPAYYELAFIMKL